MEGDICEEELEHLQEDVAAQRSPTLIDLNLSAGHVPAQRSCAQTASKHSAGHVVEKTSSALILPLIAPKPIPAPTPTPARTPPLIAPKPTPTPTLTPRIDTHLFQKDINSINYSTAVIKNNVQTMSTVNLLNLPGNRVNLNDFSTSVIPNNAVNLLNLSGNRVNLNDFSSSVIPNNAVNLLNLSGNRVNPFNYPGYKVNLPNPIVNGANTQQQQQKGVNVQFLYPVGSLKLSNSVVRDSIPPPPLSQNDSTSNWEQRPKLTAKSNTKSNTKLTAKSNTKSIPKSTTNSLNSCFTYANFAHPLKGNVWATKNRSTPTTTPAFSVRMEVDVNNRGVKLIRQPNVSSSSSGVDDSAQPADVCVKMEDRCNEGRESASGG